MKQNKVIVRALQQFIYLTDTNDYEYVDVNRELEIDIDRASKWLALGNVDVLNPYLNEGMEEYQQGFDEFKKVGNYYGA